MLGGVAAGGRLESRAFSGGGGRWPGQGQGQSIELGQPRLVVVVVSVVWCGAVGAVGAALRRGLQGAHRQGLGPWAFKSCRRRAAADKSTNDPQE
jgi:hypothetical protein